MGWGGGGDEMGEEGGTHALHVVVVTTSRPRVLARTYLCSDQNGFR